MKARSIIPLAVARWFLVCVLAWSAGAKLFWMDDFHTTLLATGMFSERTAPAVAYALPGGEFLLALVLAAGRGGSVPLFGCIGLSAVFAFVHGYVLAIGAVVPCGCAGIAVSRDSWASHLGMLVVSVGMFVASSLLLFAPPRPQAGFEPPSDTEPLEAATSGTSTSAG